MVKPAKLVISQREIAVAPFHIRTGALEHLCEPGRLPLEGILLRRAQCPQRSIRRKQRSAETLSKLTKDRKSTRLNSSHSQISYAVFCLKKTNNDVVDVLHLYEQLTGKKLVMDNFVQGKVNIFIAKDVSRVEAIKIIEMSLALNGISLAPADHDIVDVVGAGQNPRKAPVAIISDLADIPAGNPVVSFLFKLQYADPQELQQV